MNQKGRSMVEMLGVLAIIGILSVGGLEGYSRAMMKYRLNKQAQQINTLITTITQNFRKFQSMSKHTTLTDYFVKIGEIPQDMIRKDTPSYIYDVFGMGWHIFIASNGNGVFLSSYSSFAGSSSPLTTKSGDALAICKNIILTAKEHSADIYLLRTFSQKPSDNETKSFNYLGDKFCSGSGKCLGKITLEEIHNICTDHFSEYSVFEMYWSYSY